MTKLLTVVSGFCLTLLIFAGGVYTAVIFVTAEPLPDRAPGMSAAMSPGDDVVTVAKGKTETQHATGTLDAGPKPPDPFAGPQDQLASDDGASAESDSETAGTDAMTTASLARDPASPEQTDTERPKLSPQHVAWCSQRYRSYDPSANVYNAYSGEERECISPFSDTGDMGESDGQIIQASDEGSSGFVTSASAGEMPADTLDSQHIQACYDRYRSYRPEDNSYQPYGGGPRLQCE